VRRKPSTAETGASPMLPSRNPSGESHSSWSRAGPATLR
jgi:hypothetical protein